MYQWGQLKKGLKNFQGLTRKKQKEMKYKKRNLNSNLSKITGEMSESLRKESDKARWLLEWISLEAKTMSQKPKIVKKI